MRKIYLKLLLYCFAFLLLSNSSSSQVVISQVYGGGGNSGSVYTNDFIELFNSSASPVSLNGWSVQYNSAASTTSTWQVTALPGITLQPGQYFLVQEAQGAGGTTPLPTPDASGTIAMSGTAGKVVLVNNTTAFNIQCPGSGVIDLVGYGTTANCFEGAGSTPAPSNTNAVLRGSSSCTDANNNATDFTAGLPNPRNTSASLNSCSGPSLSVSVAAGTNASEPSASGTFNINLSGPAPVGGVTVTYGFSGSATVNTDYTDPLSGTVTIPEGNNSAVITLNANDDADIEGTETIQITLTTVASPVIISTGTASINLLDNDFPANPYISLINSYSEDFNTLAGSGTSSIVPTGWLFAETAANANTLYAAGTGSGTSGDTYSFGTAASDRAFGTLQSGSLISTIGAQIQNNSGGTITKLKISYTGEEWRLGTVSRTDKLSFQYSLDATTLSNGTWTNVSILNFITPNITATGAKDGNDAANRTSLGYTIRNLSIPDGAAFLIRWIDFNASGADDGLAVDDFIIEANPVDITPPAVVSVSPVNGATDIPINISAVAQFNEEIQKGTGDIRIKRSSDNSIFQTININSGIVTVSSTSLNITLSNLEVNTGYYIEVDNGAITDLDGNGFAGISGNSTWAFTTGINFYVANFQNCTAAISDGFTQYSVTGDIVWGCTTFGRDPSAPAGTTPFPNGIQINGFSGGTNVPNVDWLISPSFDLTGTNYPLLSFWSRTAFNGQPLQLKVSTDYVSGDPALASWTDINGKFPAQASNSWTLSENINLSVFKQPNTHFAFVYISDDDEGARWTIDDLALGNSPTPPPPSLTVSTTGLQFSFAASGTTADKTFSFTGNDLINDITLNATDAFALSKDGVSFSSSLLYTVAEANNISKTVYVRFAPTQNNQDFNGTVSIATGTLSAIVNLKGTSIDPVTTLEVVNWNVEWFGSTANGPTNDNQQEQNVKTILQNLDADVYALAELVSEARLANVVSQMPGYAYVISNYGSHTNTSVNPPGALAEAQKLGFIYKTSVLNNITTTPLLSQGINSAEDITNPAYNYWASGRFPFMMSADVTLNCVTKNVKFILVHGKANTSPTAASYDRRKRGADTLHYTLQQNYANDNIIILGDYNDDLDQSITAGFTTTSWNSFTSDTENFEPVTLPLSLAGKKSTVSFNDVIDHVIISNDFEPFYMNATANILSDVSSLVSNYASTTSDHYPVFSRYRFSNTTAPSVTSCTVEVSFCATNGSVYTVPLFVATDDCGDAVSYSYVITGATVRSGSSNDASGTFNIGTSIITWTATDSWGNASNCQTSVIINSNPTVTIPDANALPSGTLPNTVYIGYTPASSITLTAQAAGGTPGYSYSWSNGSVNATATVSPTINTTYAVTVTDDKKCMATASKNITVLNIRGGKKLDKVIICHKPQTDLMTLIVDPGNVADHLAHGDMLGNCPIAAQTMTRTNTIEEIVTGKLILRILPNPSANYFTLNIRTGLTNEQVNMKVTDILGRTIEQKQNLQVNQSLKIGNNYNAGLYFIEISQGKERITLKLVKL